MSRPEHLVRRRDELHRRLSGLEVALHLQLQPVPRERHKFACPRCSSARGMHAYPEPGRGLHCYACGADVFDIFIAVRGGTLPQAIAQLETLAGNSPPAAAAAPRERGVRPDPAELGEFWAHCRRVTSSRTAVAWLRDRALDPELVATLDLVRVYPDLRVHRVPGWAWSRRRFELVTPLFDETGRLGSVRFRPVPGSGADARGPYVHGGPSFSMRGLVMACATGRDVLAGATPPPGGALIVAEGEPDWLTWVTRGQCTAVLGVVAGSWTPELGARLPDGATVVIATHADEAGERYAARIAATLRGRDLDVRRLRPPAANEAAA